MKTAKALGFVKGDCVRVVVGTGYVGIVISKPTKDLLCCEIWGYEHNLALIHVSECTKIRPSTLKREYFYKLDKKPQTLVAKRVLA